MISIPVRYDWNAAMNAAPVAHCPISIPVRYDWNLVMSWMILLILIFQFQLGTIGTFAELIYPTLFAEFQFQLGTIGTLRSHSVMNWVANFNSS